VVKTPENEIEIKECKASKEFGKATEYDEDGDIQNIIYLNDKVIYMSLNLSNSEVFYTKEGAPLKARESLESLLRWRIGIMYLALESNWKKYLG